MRPRTYPTSSAISLLALIGLAALRLHGIHSGDGLWITEQHWTGDNNFSRRQIGLFSARGILLLATDNLHAHVEDEWERKQWHELFPTERRIRYLPANPALDEPWVNRHGFGLRTRDLADSANGVPSRVERCIVVPHWPPIVLTAVLPVRFLGLVVRRRRRGRLNWCLDCGYDLRESPGDCPECGRGRGVNR